MLPRFCVVAALQIIVCTLVVETVSDQKSAASTLKKIRQMFTFGYDNYMQHAYPDDELDPIHCRGRGPDVNDQTNINVNDALGNYQLTLVDALDSLAVFGNASEFKKSVQRVINTLSFNVNSVVQVFEANIRILGGLLSAHLLITDPLKHLGDLRPENYKNELLHLARDLGDRLLVAFRGTPTGIPFPRVNLGYRSVETFGRQDTCLAGAGSLLLELGTLSALLQEPRYARVARSAVLNLWRYRSTDTGLLGTDINVFTGHWINPTAGVGAGQDSFYEYLLKSAILFDDMELRGMFDEVLTSLQSNLRGDYRSTETSTSSSTNGSSAGAGCTNQRGWPAAYWNVNMLSGEMANAWVDTLQAAWPGVLTLAGYLEDARCQHDLHWGIWRRFGLPPERYNLLLKQSELAFYPLRPEFSESTYHLYRATRDPVYRRIGAFIVDNIDRHTRVRCGFATIHNVEEMTKEDRMESFFLSETLKYLYLLFDDNHPLNVHEEDYLFTTQGHLLPVSRVRQLVASLPEMSDVFRGGAGIRPSSCETHNVPLHSFYQ